jgi:hypothetical protein
VERPSWAQSEVDLEAHRLEAHRLEVHRLEAYLVDRQEVHLEELVDLAAQRQE